MKKVLGFFLSILMVALLFPSAALAASAEFIISGPDRLETGETATYTVKAKVSDAAAAQAMLEYDHRFFVTGIG